MEFKNKFEELKLVRKNFYDDCINMLDFYIINLTNWKKLRNLKN